MSIYENDLPMSNAEKLADNIIELHEEVEHFYNFRDDWKVFWDDAVSLAYKVLQEEQMKRWNL